MTENQAPDPAQASKLLAALKAARDCIQIDRTSLADAHMNPVTNRVDDPDGLAGLAEYDEVLAQLDEAVAALAAIQAPEGAQAAALQELFEPWWEKSGQFCRAGGGGYEKTFAFHAWEAAIRAALAAPAPQAPAAEVHENGGQKWARLLADLPPGTMLYAQPVQAPAEGDERAAFDEFRKRDLLDAPVHTSGEDKQWRAWQARAAWGLAHAYAEQTHAEAYYRQAEKLLTGNEQTLCAERDQLLEQLAAAQREVIELRASKVQPKGTAHIKQPYTLAELRAKLASHDYSAELLLQHAMLLLDQAPAPGADEPAGVVGCDDYAAAEPTSDLAHLTKRLPTGTKLYTRPAQAPAVGADRAAREPSPTAGMTLAQRILHVGGRNNAAGYVEFGSTQAVEALIRQVLRDLPDAPTAPQEQDLDAWECPDCGGHGKRTAYHKVTHQLGHDELPFWEACETCDGIGYCGPDAEKRAALSKPPVQGSGQ